MGTLSASYPEPPVPEVFHPPVEALTDSFDDMEDSPEVIKVFSVLPLGDCEKIASAFRKADESALFYQKRHRVLTAFAACFGTAAVVLAISELGYMELIHEGFSRWGFAIITGFLSWAELGCVSIALGVALWGVRRAYKEKWLLRRHQAESFRLLKYRFLIDPSLWKQPNWIEEQIAAIQEPDVETAVPRVIAAALEKATREPVPHGPFEVTEHFFSRKVVRALVEYYLARRLSPQKEYLANRVQKNERGDWFAFLVFWLFLGSGLAVLIRSFPVLFGWWKEGPWPAFFTLLAALLPAFAAGIRLVRGSAEFSRNKARFEAAHRALAELEELVTHDGISALMGTAAPATNPSGPKPVAVSQARTPAARFSEMSHRVEQQRAVQNPGSSSDDPDDRTYAYPVVRDLWWCEHILKSEHLEWLRLMAETEWFG
jgi:hypothetical protein